MTRLLKLPLEFVRACLIYDPQTGTLTWRTRPEDHFASRNAASVWNSKHAGKPAGSPNVKRRWSTKINGTLYQNHRLAWLLHCGIWPEDQIDHINGDPEDNRISNLRVVTNAENQKNRSLSRNNTSGTNGVYFHSRDKVWTACIREGGRQRSLGSFSNREAAAAARRAAEKRLAYSPRHGQATLG
jgi:hypothetical protein